MCIKQYDIIVWLSIIRVYGIITSFILSVRGFVFERDKPCGTQPEQEVDSTKIAGGENTREKEFLWAAVLWKNDFFICGGTLITKKHVLTAAHCVRDLSLGNLTVTIGEHDLSVDRGCQSVYPVAQIQMHQDFQLTIMDNDIAILELSEPVLIDNPCVGFACLPKSADTSYEGIMATVIGWGQLGEDEEPSNILQKVDVPIISDADCKKMGYQPEQFTSNMICAGYKEGQKDTCKGDSGSPLHRHIDSSDTMEVIGIVSWDKGCARENYPGVYTRVANYLDWIRDHIGNECICGAESS